MKIEELENYIKTRYENTLKNHDIPLNYKSIETDDDAYAFVSAGSWATIRLCEELLEKIAEREK